MAFWVKWELLGLLITLLILVLDFDWFDSDSCTNTFFFCDSWVGDNASWACYGVGLFALKLAFNRCVTWAITLNIFVKTLVVLLVWNTIWWGRMGDFCECSFISITLDVSYLWYISEGDGDHDALKLVIAGSIMCDNILFDRKFNNIFVKCWCNRENYFDTWHFSMSSFFLSHVLFSFFIQCILSFFRLHLLY